MFMNENQKAQFMNHKKNLKIPKNKKNTFERNIYKII